jgi:hypothetical protein
MTLKMENNTPGSPLADFVKKNHNLIVFSEKLSIVLLVLGLTLYFFEVSGTDIILITGSVLTAITYFLFGFKKVEVENLEPVGILNSPGFINFIYKLTNFSLSIVAITTLGLVLKVFPNGTLIITGGITLFLVLVVSFLTKVNDRIMIYNSTYYIRIVLAILLLIYLADKHYNFF